MAKTRSKNNQVKNEGDQVVVEKPHPRKNPHKKSQMSLAMMTASHVPPGMPPTRKMPHSMRSFPQTPKSTRSPLGPHRIHTSSSRRYPSSCYRFPLTRGITSLNTSPRIPAQSARGMNEAKHTAALDALIQAFLRHGPSQNTNHQDHDEPQHKPETWRENE